VRRGEAAALIRDRASQLPRLHLSADAAAGRCAAPPPVDIGSPRPRSSANLPGFDPVFYGACPCRSRGARLRARVGFPWPSSTGKPCRPSVDAPVHVHVAESNWALGLGGQRCRGGVSEAAALSRWSRRCNQVVSTYTFRPRITAGCRFDRRSHTLVYPIHPRLARKKKKISSTKDLRAREMELRTIRRRGPH
jgi:hypothetical protein